MFSRCSSAVAVALALVVLAAIACGSQPSTSAVTQPNIVVILVDDMRWDDLGAAGHPFVETPNIDRIANEGIRFTNAFATTPLCSPSRASFLTGLYAHAHGIVDNVERGAQSQALATFPRALQRAGYETAFIGKWHMGNDDSPRPGFDHWVSMQGQGALFDVELNVDGERRLFEGYTTDVFTDLAVDFLERDRTRPFLLYLPHKAIHPGRSRRVRGGFEPAPRHLGRYANAEIPRRPNYGVPPLDKPVLMRPLPDIGPPGADTVTPDDTIRARLEMLLSIDEGLGRILETLERLRVLDDTIVVVTSDHGYFYGEHGLNAVRRLAYEEAARIPLLVRYPELVPAGAKPDALALSIDLVPTLLELGGAEPDPRLQGRSLVPLLGDRAPEDWRTAILIEHHSDPPEYLEGLGSLRRAPDTGYHAVRTETHKYIRYTDVEGMDELYDLDSDPYELDNLIGRPGTEALLERMREELDRLLRETDFAA